MQRKVLITGENGKLVETYRDLGKGHGIVRGTEICDPEGHRCGRRVGGHTSPGISNNPSQTSKPSQNEE